MDKISVENLMKNSNNISTENKEINVYNLSGSNLNDSVNIINSFNIDTLIQKKNANRQKINDKYNRYYASCLHEIKMAISIDKTDFIFDVPKIDIECPEYSSLSCIVFIEKRLREQFIDTYKINQTSLFITLKYVEINKKNNKINN
jgi:hypothetical protein